MDFKLPKRAQNSHKGTFGKVLNIAGSKYMPGAAYLSSVSALTVGCGYVYLSSEESVIQTVASQTQNIVFAPLKDIELHKKDANVLSIGCGISTSDDAVKLFKTTVTDDLSYHVLIDADGLNILSILKDFKLPKKLILTPHPKEASRLLGVNVEDILKDTVFSAKLISKKYNCVTVLKSHETIVCSQNLEIYQNTTGNSALAKAGSGDVLTGIISGLLAQGMDLFEGTCLGVYLHGLCGDLAKNDLTEYGVLAADQIRYIPYAIKKVINL